MIRIALAEDNDFLAHSLQEKLEMLPGLQLKFRAVNGAELIKKLTADASVDLVLMDIEMPEMDGIEATALARKQFPQIPVIMLTVFDDEDKIFRSIQAGANGYLLKDTPPQKLLEGIHEIMEGGAPMSPSIALKALRLLRMPHRTPDKTNEDFGLSTREKEVLEQMSMGLKYGEIAGNLFISPSTVRKHTENIYKKLQVHSKVEAVQLASKKGLV